MFLSYELSLPEEEIGTWPLDKMTKWLAFFKLKGDLEAEAYKKK